MGQVVGRARDCCERASESDYQRRRHDTGEREVEPHRTAHLFPLWRSPPASRRSQSRPRRKRASACLRLVTAERRVREQWSAALSCAGVMGAASVHRTVAPSLLMLRTLAARPSLPALRRCARSTARSSLCSGSTRSHGLSTTTHDRPPSSPSCPPSAPAPPSSALKHAPLRFE